MLKIIRGILYGAAILSGLAGLFAGGRPFVKYVINWFREPENHYFDTAYLFSPGVIFLLSLMLLLFVNIAIIFGRKNSTGRLPGQPAESLPPPHNKNSPGVVAEIAVSTDPENANEKLARLLQQKNE